MTKREIWGRQQQWMTQPLPVAFVISSKGWQTRNPSLAPHSCSFEFCIAPPGFGEGQGQSWHLEPQKWLFEVNMASEEQNSTLTAKLGTGITKITSQNNRITSTVRGPLLWLQEVGEKPNVAQIHWRTVLTLLKSNGKDAETCMA